jgi:hypothetical protein
VGGIGRWHEPSADVRLGSPSRCTHEAVVICNACRILLVPDPIQLTGPCSQEEVQRTRLHTGRVRSTNFREPTRRIMARRPKRIACSPLLYTVPACSCIPRRHWQDASDTPTAPLLLAQRVPSTIDVVRPGLGLCLVRRADSQRREAKCVDCIVPSRAAPSAQRPAPRAQRRGVW